MEQRLFRLAAEAINVQAVFEPGVGWRCKVIMRRQGECWDECDTDQYSMLSTPELLDVICLEVAGKLGLA